MFDTAPDRLASGSSKWNLMERGFGVSPADGIPMWIADMEFEPAPCIRRAAEQIVAAGDFGYFTEAGYRDSICHWMESRHGWEVDPDWITTTAGLGNGIAIALLTFTEPGDEVAIFTPVYHEFRNKITAAGRVVRELPLVVEDGRFTMDFDGYEAMLSGRERMVIASSPHNPGGRLWTEAEQRGLAAFCERHDLLLIADEVHHDIVLPGHRHHSFLTVAPEAAGRTIMMTSASKVFNIAGLRNGNVILPDPDLRQRYAGMLHALNLQPNMFGLKLTQAAYSPEGGEWVDALCRYLGDNAALFEARVGAIPGITAMPLEATYLAWVDFSGTGMDREEIDTRVYGTARLCPSPGPGFGTGGEVGHRFNIAMPRDRLEIAITRLEEAFSDLQ